MSSFLFSSLFNLSHTRPRRTMDSIRVSEAPDSGSIPDEATITINKFQCSLRFPFASMPDFNPLCILSDLDEAFAV